jgi:hypothetical protein
MTNESLMNAYSVLFSTGERWCFIARNEEQARARAAYHFPSLSLVSIEQIDNDSSNDAA